LAPLSRMPCAARVCCADPRQDVAGAA
jgi:hypothetical protein